MSASHKAPLMVRCLAEALGTCLLVFVGTGTVVTALTLAHQARYEALVTTVIMVALANGIIRFVTIVVIGHISGAHINPAITVSLVMIRRFPLVDALGYILAQVVGALVGAGLVVGIMGTSALTAAGLAGPRLGSTGLIQGLAIEAIGTAILVVAFIATMIDVHAPVGWSALTVGLALAGITCFIWPATGALVNPARAFASDALIWVASVPVQWEVYALVYLAGPLIGGIIAALLSNFVAPMSSERT